MTYKRENVRKSNGSQGVGSPHSTDEADVMLVEERRCDTKIDLVKDTWTTHGGRQQHGNEIGKNSRDGKIRPRIKIHLNRTPH